MKNLGEHIVIKKVLFDIDYYPLKLQQSDHPENSLMIDRALAKDGYYHVVLDNDDKIIQLPEYSSCASSARVPVNVFEKGYVDDFIIADAMNNYSIRNELNFLVPNKYILNGLNGVPPEIFIGEVKFIYHGEKELLIPCDGKTSPIPLSNFSIIDTGYITENDEYEMDYLSGLYHVKSRSAIDLDMESITKWPKGVVYIEIPGPSVADPIGVARKGGHTLVSHLSHRYPIDHGPAKVEELSHHWDNKLLENKNKLNPGSVIKVGRKRSRKPPI